MNFLTNRMIKYFAHHSKICIIGGGTGGVNVSAHLLRSKINPRDITIFQPQKYHYYQAGWTLVGVGMGYAEDTRQPMQKVIPQNIHLIKQSAKLIQPQKNLIITDKNHQYTYDHLIISSGLVLNWQDIKGSKELLEDQFSKVCSVYDYNYVDKTASLGKRFKGGKALFTQPKLPIKCSGAPMKVAFLWTTEWSKNHVIKLSPQIIKAQSTMFPVSKYGDELFKFAKDKGIKVTFEHNLIEVTPQKAIFEHVLSKQRLEKEYDFLHLVPPMSPPSFIAQSGLGNKAGYVDVHDNTLRHQKYPNVWSLGDSSSLPTSKTAGAIYSQTPILVKNLLAVLKNPNQKQLPGKYTGYTGCPIFVGGKKAMMAQLLYNKQIDQSFFKDQQKPRRLFYYMTKYFFPFAYWKLMPRGLWKGRDGIRWTQKL